MDTCDYGCEQKAKYTFKNGKRCCSSWYRSCPFQAKKIGQTRQGKKHSEKTKHIIGEKSKQRIQERGGSYFKGRKHTDEAKQKMSQKKKGIPKPPNYVPWNRGLTKVDDPRIASGDQVRRAGCDNGMFGKTHSIVIKEKQRQRNLKEGKWKGKNNPWYGKNRSGENSPRFMTFKERSEWEIYRNTVRSTTERVYRKNKHLINPKEVNRSTQGYHLDHVIPIWYGFENNIPINILTNPRNLRIIHSKQNLKRYKTKITEKEEELLQELTQGE